MIVDTDVIIWYMRGNQKAFDIIEDLDNFYISSVTYMELIQGMRNKIELNNLRKAINSWNTKIIHISEEISVRASFSMEQHFLSNSLQLVDALIGATASIYALPILTGNDKHFKIIEDIQIIPFRP